MTEQKRVTLAMTGASGVQYGLRLLDCLLMQNVKVSLLLSAAAREVVRVETDVVLPDDVIAQKCFFIELANCQPTLLDVYDVMDWHSPVASGSGAPPLMVICPCSAGTLSAVACGASNNLIERAADVVLKERHQLIMVPREMPLSSLHLENMLKLSNMGVTIMPASPGFYHKPDSVSDMVDFVVARIMDQLGVKQSLLTSWGK